MIRQATEEDILDILVLGKQFIKESGYTWDKNKTHDTIASLLASPLGTVLVWQEAGEIVGALMGIITNPFLSHNKEAYEIAWFVDPDFRGKKGSLYLLKEFEDWARSEQCDAIVMGDIVAVSNLCKLYERRGYKPVERLYKKEI